MTFIDYTAHKWRIRQGVMEFYISDSVTDYAEIGEMLMFKGKPTIRLVKLNNEVKFVIFDLLKLADTQNQ